MTKKAIGVVLLIIAGLILVVTITSPLWLPADSYNHYGIVYLDEDQYSELKSFVVVESIPVSNVAILNHDFPVVAELSFKYNSPDSLFGEETCEHRETDYMPLFLFAFVPGFLGAIMYDLGE